MPKSTGNRPVGDTVIEFDGVPFRPIKTQTHHCQHGKQYFKRERTTKRLCIQCTKKMGCPAHIIVTTSSHRHFCGYIKRSGSRIY